MNALAFYLLKSSCWITGFTLIYLLFLRNERYFKLKRIFLLAGIIASFIMPFFTLHYQVQIPPIPHPPSTDFSFNYDSVDYGVQELIPEPFNYGRLLMIIYVAGLIFATAKVFWNISHITRSIRENNFHKNDSAIIVRSCDFSSSFSFFNFIFINPSVEENELAEIMNHELVHVRQKHWFDLVLAELLRIVQWVNPFAWIYSGFIKLNHEYLADEGALQSTSDPAKYKAVLINQMFRSPVFSLSNSFNYSLNKNRFEMMKKIITSPYRKLRLLFILPVFAIVLYAFAEPQYVEGEASEGKELVELTLEKVPVTDTALTGAIHDSGKEVKGNVTGKDGKPMSNVQIAVTGTTIRSKTDEAGNFMLPDIPEDSHIVFSAKGFLTQVLKPEFGRTMKITMEKDTSYVEHELKAMEDALVVVDGKVREEKAADISKIISPNEIQSIYVLKGENAVSKYGEKAGKGVIEITTKKSGGKESSQVFTGSERKNPEDFPTFQGKSHIDFGRWLAEQITYPKEASDLGIQGRATINFTVLPGGLIGRSQMISAPHPSIGDAMMKAIDPLKTNALWEDPGNPEMKLPYNGSVTLKFELPDKITLDDTYIVTDEMPVYPGGDAALLKYIAGTTIYPAEAKEKKIEGRVIVRFVVRKDGNVEDATVLKGVHPLLDNEALRVVNTLSGFSPGKKNGEPVNVWYMVPISFTLSGKPAARVGEQPFVVVEEMPMYKGGDEAILRDIRSRLIYPESAKQNKIEGRVILRFLVTAEGKIEQVTVLKGLDPELDREAIRVVESLEDFSPGKQGGQPVPVWYMVPVSFSLPLLEGKSEQLLLKYIVTNITYPSSARANAASGTVYVRVSMEKGGVVKDARVVDKNTKATFLPEIVIVGYKSENPGDLRINPQGDQQGNGLVALEEECLRVVRMIGNADIPEFREKDLDFVIAIKFVLADKVNN